MFPYLDLHSSDNFLQGELEHRLSKRRYERTNKHNFVLQLAKHEARERFLKKLDMVLFGQRKLHKAWARERKRLERRSQLPYVNPSDHYHISVSTRDASHLDVWLQMMEDEFQVPVRSLLAFSAAVWYYHPPLIFVTGYICTSARSPPRTFAWQGI